MSSLCSLWFDAESTKVDAISRNNGLRTVQFTQSRKFNRASLNKGHEFPYWGLNICIDFDLRDLKNGEYEETK